MARYALMKAPVKPDEHSSQISIIDDNTFIGKRRAETMTEEGWEFIGRIESELSLNELRSGFKHELQKRVEDGQDLLWSIQKLSNQVI